MLELYPNYIANHTRLLQEVVYTEKNKWKHKFVNYVTVNYVTTILVNPNISLNAYTSWSKRLFLIKANLSQLIKINLNHIAVVNFL